MKCKMCEEKKDRSPRTWPVIVAALLVFFASAVAAVADGIEVHGQAEVRRFAHKVGGQGEQEESRIDVLARWKWLEARTWTRIGLREIHLVGGFPHGVPVTMDGGAELALRTPEVRVEGLTITPRLLLFGGESRHLYDGREGGYYTATWAGLGAEISTPGGWKYIIEARQNIEAESGETIRWTTYQFWLSDFGDAEVIGVSLDCNPDTEAGGLCENRTVYIPGDFPRRWLSVSMLPPTVRLGRGVQLSPYVDTRLVNVRRRWTESAPRLYVDATAGVRVDLDSRLYVDLRYAVERRPEDSRDLRRVRSAWSGSVGLRW